MSMDPERRRPIGVFDSGVGGLTVVRALRLALPGEDIVYLGDTARLPYGTKSPRTVQMYSLACMNFLLGHKVKQVVVACNTATANAIDVLERAAPVPVVGAVTPGAQAAVAASANGHIGVLGTLGTVASNAYVRAITSMLPSAQVSQLPCPLLVPLAEEGWVDGEVATLVARRYLEDLFALDNQLDTIVLGCTHYPLLAPVIQATARTLAGRAVSIVDSAAAMAVEVRKRVHELGDQAKHAEAQRNRRNTRGALRCFATDGSRLGELAPRFLGEPTEPFQIVDI